MSEAELAHLELLAEVDALVERLRSWADAAPAWPPAQMCRALLRRLSERADAMRVRLEAPLVVATLGGTGTGKSALVNALLGSEVVATGRQRPVTTRPTLICRPDITPQMLGIERGSVELIQRELPALRELVLIDCPDPDTTEECGDEVTARQSHVAQEDTLTPVLSRRERERALTPALSQGERGSNLARLRAILPKCDVLLVTATQQKYRSARVADELAASAGGARMVFVATHAAVDDDIRDDWRQMLQTQYDAGRIFRVDSLSALADADAGRPPQGDFAALLDLLTRQLGGTAAARIRRANFFDLAAETLARCRQRLDPQMPGVQQLAAALETERAMLGAQLAQQVRTELLGSRRSWENRLLGQVAARWGFSPFALVLRAFQGLGGLLAGALLWRVRTPAQMALWGAAQGARAWQHRRREARADQSAARAVSQCWDQSELRAAAFRIEGYLGEAALPRGLMAGEVLAAEAAQAGGNFVARTAGELDALIARIAARNSGWLTRCLYELLLAAMLGALLYRLGKNFFYDSWLAPQPGPVYGLEFYLAAGFWLLLWCEVLIWTFSRRLRRGLRRELDGLAAQWADATAASGLFAAVDGECRRIEDFRQQLDAIEQHIAQLRGQATGREELGFRR